MSPCYDVLCMSVVLSLVSIVYKSWFFVTPEQLSLIWPTHFCAIVVLVLLC